MRRPAVRPAGSHGCSSHAACSSPNQKLRRQQHRLQHRLQQAHPQLPLLPAAAPPLPAAAHLSPCALSMAALSRLLGCNVYVSEGRNATVIRELEALCQRRRHVVLANTFIDAPYNRTGLTLAATSIPELVATVLGVAQAALAALDLTQHVADHPRLGVLDHVSLHPLGPAASLQHAAEATAALGQALAAPPLQLPVYLYGAAHPAGRRLAEIRRSLGYFEAARQPGSSSSSSSQPEKKQQQQHQPSWCGSIAQLDLTAYPPDAGPVHAAPAAGVVTLGAVPWVVNYNVPLHTADMAAARAVARAVSTRGGGLRGVEAMALPHGDGVIEVATNLVELDWRRLGCDSADASNITTSSSSSDDALQGAGPAEVAAAVAAAAAAHGLPPPGRGYITNKLPQQLVALAAQQLGGDAA